MGKKKKKGKSVDWHAVISDQLIRAAFIANPEESLSKIKQLSSHEVFPEVLDNENNLGRTALQYASVRGNTDTVRLLVRAGACVDLACRFGHTPLHLAAWYGHIEVAELLLRSDAALDVTDRLGETPLHSAAWAGHAEVVKLLLTAGVEIEAENQDQRRALHLAAAQGQAEVVKLLLDAGAMVGAVDADGHKAHELADQHQQAAEEQGSLVNTQIGAMLRTHADIQRCEQSIRILQAQARGPVAHDTVLRGYGLLPPLPPSDEVTEVVNVTSSSTKEIYLDAHF